MFLVSGAEGTPWIIGEKLASLFLRPMKIIRAFSSGRGEDHPLLGRLVLSDFIHIPFLSRDTMTTGWTGANLSTRDQIPNNPNSEEEVLFPSSHHPLLSPAATKNLLNPT